MDERSKAQALRAFEAARSTLAATCDSAQEQLQAVQVSQGSATASQPVPQSCESEVTLQGLQEGLLRMRQASQAQPSPTPMDMSSS